MDTKSYFYTVREYESLIEEEFPLVISLEGLEGGREGVPIEVSRALAAKMIVDKSARLATKEESDAFRAKVERERREIRERELASKVQYTIVPASQLKHEKES